MSAYYNEFDPFAADWMENLIKEGLIPNGVVDRRSIKDVSPSDVAEHDQVHLFAGIGGWPLALRLAGWDDARPVWTGSCPCQPFSAAGKGKAQSDDRHLWPVMFGLIDTIRPVTVFGEQVSSAIRHGWLDGICTDLERAGYACGSVVCGAHSVGSPHIRQRLYWVADSTESRCCGRENCRAGGGDEESNVGRRVESERGVHAGGLANTKHGRREGRNEIGARAAATLPSSSWGESNIVHCTDGKSRRVGSSVQPLANGIPRDMGRGIPELSRLVQSARSNRTGRLKGYGNAIVPQVAAEFVRAFMEINNK